VEKLDVCGRDPKIVAATAGDSMPEDMNGQASRPPKKTEMIEVRVSHETKRDFLAACKTAGRSASDVIREGMQAFIDRQAQREASPGEQTVVPFKERLLRKRYMAVAVAATGIAGFAALPSAAAPDLAGMFARLDVNGDGVLTDAEFGRRESPGVKEMGLRIPRRTPPEPKVDSAEARIFLIPAPADGTLALEQMRDVRLQGIGIPPAASDRVAASFAAFDANKNGTLEVQEFVARQRLMLTNGFATLDKDADGGLDASEYAALGTSFVLYPADAVLELGVAAKYGPLVSPATIEDEFAKHDADHDGKLSLQEYLPAK
jgi:Ca2+-binding EF-hand superfamily protein/Arc/MetJ-type ribon-helix-helix transcriptional regulator